MLPRFRTSENAYRCITLSTHSNNKQIIVTHKVQSTRHNFVQQDGHTILGCDELTGTLVTPAPRILPFAQLQVAETS